MSTSKTIQNLEQFLAWRGLSIEDGAWRWARAFYKYTGCGPWAIFLTQGEPAREEKFTFYVRRDPQGKLRAVSETPLPENIMRSFGFTPQGKPSREEKAYCKTLKGYAEAVRLYQKRLNGRDDISIELIHEGPTDPKPGEHRWVMVSFTLRTPATINEIYYEDKAVDTVTNANCVGIKFGSIVEGSEANSGPFTHMFPIDTKKFDKDIEFMEKETSFYWKRDNASWYRVSTPDEEWIATNSWGDIEWEGTPPPDDIKTAAEKAIQNDWQDDPKFPGCIRQTLPVEANMWEEPNPGWKPFGLGVANATIHSFTNDTTFD